MATKKSESEKLKAKIKYLTDLINKAKTVGHLEHKKPRMKAVTRPQLHSTKWMKQPAPVQFSKRKDLISIHQRKGSSSSQCLTLSASKFHWKSSKSQDEPSVSLLNKKSFQIQSIVPKKEDKNQDVPRISCIPSDQKQMITTSLQDNYFKAEVSKKTASPVDPAYKIAKPSFSSSKKTHILNSTATSEKSICSVKQPVNSSSQKITEITDTKANLDTEIQKISEYTLTKASLDTKRQKITKISDPKASLDTKGQKITEIAGIKAAADTKQQKRTGIKASLDTKGQKIPEITGIKAAADTKQQKRTGIKASLDTKGQKIPEIAGIKAAADTKQQKRTGIKASLDTKGLKMSEIAGIKAAADTKQQKRTGIKAALDTERQKMSEITGSEAALDAKRLKMTADPIAHLSPLKESTSVISPTESSMRSNLDKLRLRQVLLETKVRMINLENCISEQKDKLANMSSTKSPVHDVFQKHILNKEKTLLTSSPSSSGNLKGFRKAELTETMVHSVSPVEKAKGSNSLRTRFKILNKSSNQERTGTHGNIEKKVIKTRYSIRKISNNSESTASDKKRTRSSLVTQYNLRRSVNNNPETLPTTNTSSTTVKRSSDYDTSHAQLVAKTIRSKYKLKKVLVDRSKLTSPKFSPKSIDYHESKMKWTARKQRNSSSWSTWKGKLKSHYTGAHKYYLGYTNFVTRAGQASRGRYAGSRTSSWHTPYVLQKGQKQNYFHIRNAASKVQYLKEHIPFNPRLRIDRRKQERKEIPQAGVLSISTNRMVNRSSSRKMRLRNPIIVKNVKLSFADVKSTCTKIFTINGVKFKMDTSGKSLQRISPVKAKASSVTPRKSPVSRVDIGGVTYIQTKPGTLEIDSSYKTRALASQVVHKSLVTAMAANYKKTNAFKLMAKRYCKFYNRFGKCNRGDKCPYIHDPDKIVVCTRFLRGTCKVTDCPFSHKISKEKMPVCSFFLRGICNRDDCPYQHVNVGKDAKLCQDFVNGYCPLGEKCKKRHILVCTHFSRTGSCPDGKQCKLVHKRPRKRTNSFVSGKEHTA
ncbi:hypothetical protein ACJMK2_010222, partial [Sinanodonta woodiana]